MFATLQSDFKWDALGTRDNAYYSRRSPRGYVGYRPRNLSIRNLFKTRVAGGVTIGSGVGPSKINKSR